MTLPELIKRHEKMAAYLRKKAADRPKRHLVQRTQDLHSAYALELTVGHLRRLQAIEAKENQ